MEIIYIVGGLYTEASGIGRILCDLANAMGQRGNPVRVYTAYCKNEKPADHLLTPPNRCIAEPGLWMGRLSSSPALKRKLTSDIPDVDVVHNHSMWMLPNAYSSQIAYNLKKPVLFTAYGYLEPWALSHSRWKKRVVGWWFQNRDLKRAACIHVNSIHEIEGIRSYGLKNPIAVIPNGVRLSDFSDLPDRSEFITAYPALSDKRIILFLSRLHPKKGLSHLVAAWKRIKGDHREWHLVIAGPDDGHETEIRRQVEKMALSESVTFTGLLTGRDKLAAYSAADVFALPSFSEGFSMAILEALSCRLPVLITPMCNFPDVAKIGAGIEVMPDIDHTEKGLRDLIEMSDNERNRAGRLGRQLIEESYTWDYIAAKMMDLYKWMSGGGPVPPTVETR